MSQSRIKVLVVDDSATVRSFLSGLLSSDPRIDVVGTAAGGEEAMESVQRLDPDVVTMDVNMPITDGFEVTRRIMENHPTPVVIVSSVWKPEEVATTFRAVEAGAVAVVAMPSGPGHSLHDPQSRRLLDTVKSMSEVKVVRRRARTDSLMPKSPVPRIPTKRSRVAIVAIGASTGGPTVLQTILAALPKDYPVPLLIVQHIAPGFIDGLAQWLQESTGFTVRIAKSLETLMPATAYFAPDEHHLEVRPDGRVFLNPDAPDNGLRPSVGRLFASVATAYGSNAAGVLLTGMGRDGAEQLKALRNCGALTMAQDQETSLVYGMPGEAAKIDAAEHLLPPDQIAAMLAIAVKPFPKSADSTGTQR